MNMKKILAAKPSITELEIGYVNDAVANGWGEQCYDYLIRFKERLQEYFAVSEVWLTSSCHGALHIVLQALGVKTGDEVIVPDLTWMGSVVPVSWLGATPVFVDSLPESWCIDPDKIRASITERTKAIIVVHLYGNLCAMDEIMEIGREYGIPVIEDAAEAVGSEYKGRKAGSIGDFGVFSMHGTKTLTAGEGGALLSNREDYRERISIIESQGRRPQKHIHYWVDEIGLKYKMSNLQAALGLAQFERAEELIASKRRIFDCYRELLVSLADIMLNPEPQGCLNSYWQPTIIFGKSWQMTYEKRNALIDVVNARGVAIRPLFYPVSNFPMYTPCLSNTVARDLAPRGINLPSYYELTEEDCQRVVQEVRSCL